MGASLMNFLSISRYGRGRNASALVLSPCHGGVLKDKWKVTDKFQMFMALSYFKVCAMVQTIFSKCPIIFIIITITNTMGWIRYLPPLKSYISSAHVQFVEANHGKYD